MLNNATTCTTHRHTFTRTAGTGHCGHSQKLSYAYQKPHREWQLMCSRYTTSALPIMPRHLFMKIDTKRRDVMCGRNLVQNCKVSSGPTTYASTFCKVSIESRMLHYSRSVEDCCLLMQCQWMMVKCLNTRSQNYQHQHQHSWPWSPTWRSSISSASSQTSSAPSSWSSPLL